MKYYIIAGEASGDLHGSNLIKELKKQDTNATIKCWGGDLMHQAGATLVKHYRDLAFMGFLEVVKNLPTIFKNLKFCKQNILEFKPDILVLIDYPGFNLRIAKWAKQNGFKIVYYISPQVWAWKESRVTQMKKDIDKMICILPFEKDYYKTKWNWEVEFVGHPLIEVIQNFKSTHTSTEKLDKKIVVAILPGSRKQEIAKKLPIMLTVANQYSDYKYVVAKAPGIEDSFYKSFLKSFSNVSSVSNQTYELLSKSDVAFVTSGTATLETALLGIPEIVCYKTSGLSYWIGKQLIKIKYISLVNLIMDKLVVKELIQNELNTQNLCKELYELLNNSAKKEQLNDDYKILWQKLSTEESASKKAATIIINTIK